MFLKLHIKKTPDKHWEKESNHSTVLCKRLYKIITNISDKQVWNALVARQKQEYEASTHWDHRYLKPENNSAWKKIQTQTTKNKKKKNHRPLQQNHNSTTAWEIGERASRNKKKTEEPECKRGGESNKNKHTHSLRVKAWKYHEKLFCFCSEVNKSIVSPEISQQIQLSKKGFVHLIIRFTIIVGVKNCHI